MSGCLLMNFNDLVSCFTVGVVGGQSSIDDKFGYKKNKKMSRTCQRTMHVMTAKTSSAVRKLR